jgi:photosystem II stability/assembly factor-like uncharacterized protein
MSTTTRRVALILLFTLVFTAPLVQAGGLASWVPVGPGAGADFPSGFASVTVHPAAPGAVWVGLPQGGLYRSTDQGVNWRWAGGPFLGDREGVVAVAADPSGPGVLWAATREGLFRTPDAGAHWTRESGDDWLSLLGNENPEHLVSVPGTLYLVLYRRLLASPDGGHSWTVLRDQGAGSIQSFAVHPAAPQLLSLAVLEPDGPALVQSFDRGHTWTAVTTLPPRFDVIQQVVAARNAVYVVVVGEAAGILRSTDQGRTWTRVLGGTPERPFVGTLMIDARAPRTLHASGNLGANGEETGLWISRNAGATWRKLLSRRVFYVQSDAAAGLLYAVDGSTLLRSRNGGVAWAAVLRAPQGGSSFAHISFRRGDPSLQALAIGFTLHRSVNGGRTWKQAGATPDIRDVDIDPADPNRLIAIAFHSAYVSDDAGQTWQPTTGAYDFNYTELLVRADEQTLLAGGAGIYRSGDNGRTWQTVLPGWVPGVRTGRWAQKIEIDPSNASILYALTFLAKAVEPPHDVLSDFPSILWKSTDGGRTWKKVTLNLRTFAVDPGTSRLYGAREQQILASDDQGKTWRPIGQTPQFIHDLVIDPTDSNVFYATGYGFYLSRSRDRGATWELVSDTWTPATLKFDPDHPRTLYGTDWVRVFKMTVPE